MSANLPINWADKKNSPILADFIAKYGPEYCMTAEEINQLRNAVNEMVVIQQSTFLGAAEPTFTPAGTGRAYWIAVKPGTYPNHGGVVVATNEIAFVVRDAAGAFTITKSGLDLSIAIGPPGPASTVPGPVGPAGTARMLPWEPVAYTINSQVNHLGKDWYNTLATVAGDVPGTSSKWVDRLSAYGDKINSKSVNLVNVSLLQKGLNPNADGTWAGNSFENWYGYSFIAPLSDFYSFENLLMGGFMFYIFDASGVKIKDMTANKSANIYLNKGEKFNFSFANNGISSKITCRKDTNLTLGDIVATEYDFRIDNIVKNNYFNFIDSSKIISGQYNASNETTESNASSNITPATKIVKGVFYRIGARLGNTFDLIFNVDGSFSRAVGVGHQGIIEFVDNEAYISMSFLNTETQIGLCNRNTYIAYGDLEPKPSAVFSDLEIPLESEITSFDCLISPNPNVAVSLVGLSFDTSKRIFALNDLVRIKAKVKPSVIYAPDLSFGFGTFSGGTDSENLVFNWQNQTLPATVGNYTYADFTITVNQQMVDTLNAGAEIGLVLSVWGITNKSDWQVLCEELTVINLTKGFTVNKITNINKIQSYYDKEPKIVSGKLFKPTTVRTPNLLRDAALDTRNLKGKRVLCIGDSITEGTNGRYVKWLQTISGGAVTNIGSSGAGITRMIALLTGWTEFDASGRDLGIDITKYDVITIMAGTNGGDFTGNMSTAYVANNVFNLPKVINSVNYATPKAFFVDLFRSTFCDSYSVLIQYIQYYNSNCKIYLITPPVNATNATLAENRMVQLNSIADYYNVEMINAYKNTGMNLMNFLSKYSSDGIHLNALGNDIWGKYIGNQINKSV